MGLLNSNSLNNWLTQTLPQNARNLWGEIKQAPADLKGLFANPNNLAQLNQTLANSKWSSLDKDKAMSMAMDYLQTTNPVGGLLAHTVYHGSPHKFDKFDMSKIGTGEGAQAYGHGLYFAESDNVARSYQKIGDPALVSADTIAAYSAKGQSKADALQQMRGQRDFYKRIGDNDTANKYKEALRLVKANAAAKEIGNLYKVDIPDEAIPRMLDWDKPLSEQHPDVQAALKKSGALKEDGSLSFMYNETPSTGREMYERLTSPMAQKVRGETDASAFLKNQGIPGIRYLDQGSRATTGGELIDLMKSPEGYRAKIRVTNRTGVGFQSPTDMFTTSGPFKTAEEAQQWANSKINQGTSNFVLFDDQLPRILEVNGQPTGLLSYADEAKKAKKQ